MPWGQRLSYAVALGFGTLLAASVSCSSSSSSHVEQRCDVGSRRDCTCDNGETGSSVCDDAGVYGACTCTDGTGGSSGNGGGAGSGGGSSGTGGGSGGAGGSGGTSGSGGDAGSGGSAGAQARSCVVQMVAGSYDTCALKDDQTVWCWGNGNPSPTPVDGLTEVVELASGTFHKCARKVDGTVWCWGTNSAGQLGDGTLDERTVPVQATLADDRATFIQITAGGFSTCARLQGGSAWCWGANGAGQTGNGTATPSEPVPVEVSAVDATLVAEIIAEGGHTCARMTDGSLRCWGGNSDGELGDATTDPGPKLSSVEVAVLGTSVLRSSGRCAIKGDLTLWCWGMNTSGQVGDTTTELRTSPVQVAVDSQIAEVTRTFFKTCSRDLDGAVWCWGRNGEGSLGDGTIGGQPCPNGECKPTPVRVTGLNGAAALTGGIAHTCAATNDGSTWCWGANNQGQLGDGTLEGEACTGGPCRPTPVQAQLTCP